MLLDLAPGYIFVLRSTICSVVCHSSHCSLISSRIALRNDYISAASAVSARDLPLPVGRRPAQSWRCPCKYGAQQQRGAKRREVRELIGEIKPVVNHFTTFHQKCNLFELEGQR